MWGLEVGMTDVHPKERGIKVLRFCLESQNFRIITEGHFLRVVISQCFTGPVTCPQSLGRRKHALKMRGFYRDVVTRTETQVRQEQPEQRAEKLKRQEKKRVLGEPREKKTKQKPGVKATTPREATE